MDMAWHGMIWHIYIRSMSSTPLRNVIVTVTVTVTTTPVRSYQTRPDQTKMRIFDLKKKKIKFLLKKALRPDQPIGKKKTNTFFLILAEHRHFFSVLYEKGGKGKGIK